MMDLEEVQKRHVWLLTTVIEMPDGSLKYIIVHEHHVELLLMNS